MIFTAEYLSRVVVAEKKLKFVFSFLTPLNKSSGGDSSSKSGFSEISNDAKCLATLTASSVVLSIINSVNAGYINKTTYVGNSVASARDTINVFLSKGFRQILSPVIFL